MADPKLPVPKNTPYTPANPKQSKPAPAKKPAPTPAANAFQGLIDKALKGGAAQAPTTAKTQNADQIAIGMFKKYAPNWIKTGYWQTVLTYAHQYHVPAPYLASLFIAENPKADPKEPNQSGSSALGLAQILDTNLLNYNKGKALVWGNGNTLATGSVITPDMKRNPVFAIAYAAWRIAGQIDTYGNFKDAYMKGYSDGKIDPQKFYGNYVPSKADWTASKLNTKLSNQPTNQATDPFVTFDKKTGAMGTSLDSNAKNVVEFEGFPITVGTLKQQLQDKNGLGGDFYSLTGQTPNIKVVAALMASGKTTQQLENLLIDSKYFMKSPTGKKYALSYQGVYQSIMGANAKLPTGTTAKNAKGKNVTTGSWAQMVKNAAKNNLTTDEFATQIRNSPGYLQSNEFKQNRTAFSDSYQHIYGPMDDNAKRLASDAALSGWNQTQWEHYLRSQPGYTKTPEYKAHALDILDNLGLTFGFLPSLQQGQGQTPSPGVTGSPDSAPGTDKRVPGLVGAPQPHDATQGLGVSY